MEDFHEIELAGLRRRLPLVQVAPGVRIAAFVLLGDVELVAACADRLARELTQALGPALREALLVGPEAKAVPLVHAVAERLGQPRCVICRKSLKTYMQEGIEVPVESITTPGAQRLVVSAADAARLRGRDVVLLDDVVSTGGTLRALEALMARCGARVLGRAAALAEGGGVPGVLTLGTLPVWQA